MDYLEYFGYSIPRLSLGTVALGLDYGIANPAGRPGKEEAFAVLATALDAGISCWDTARTYGDAEELIGEFLQSRTAPVTLVTKFKIGSESLDDSKVAIDAAVCSVRASLKALRVPSVPLALLHMERHLPIVRVRKLLLLILDELKQMGLIMRGGISVDHPDEAVYFADEPVIDAMQVPINIFDQRLIQSGALAQMERAGKLVFARSVFLQGLFFVNPDHLAGNLQQAAEPLRQLGEIARGESVSVAQLAFSFVRDLPGISSIIFGAERSSQVNDTMGLYGGKAISDEGRDRLRTLYAAMPEEVITPAMWTN